MSVSVTRAVVFGTALLITPVAQAATLDGLTLSADYRLPDAETAYPSATSTGPFVVGAGVDGVISIEDVTNISLDFSGNSLAILLNTTLSSPTWGDMAFNGLRIALGSAGSFTSFAQTSSSIGPVTTSFDSDELFIDWGGHGYVDGSTLTFDIGYEAPAPAPVPLPASALLLLGGMGGFAALRRRHKAA